MSDIDVSYTATQKMPTVTTWLQEQPDYKNHWAKFLDICVLSVLTGLRSLIPTK
jgi:hypothetical protein